MVMVPSMCVVMVMMVRLVRQCIGVGKRIWRKAESIEWTWPILSRLIMMMVVMMWMDVMMVVMRRLGAFGAALWFRRVSRKPVHLLFVVS